MTAVAEEILHKALGLDTTERATVAALLLDSLETEPDEEVEAAWAAEIQRRAEELESGKVKGIPWEEVRDRLKRGLGES
ncbi:MAG: addiction module protein [Acidobacteriota bacterium]